MSAFSGPSLLPSYIDLHSHSTASDGSRAPADVVAAAKHAGIVALALTDHDTLGGVAAATAAGHALGVRVIAGVELSLFDDEGESHVLGLHIERVDELDQELVPYRDARRRRAEQMVDRLNAVGVPVTLEAVLTNAAGAAIGRPHVARALVSGGWVSDFREAFDRYIGFGRPAYVEKKKLGVGDGIALIHSCGGLAVLAHPGESGRRARLEALLALGLDGVEVLHPGHSTEDIERLDALAEFLRLVPSGGSDWHGAAEGPRCLGSQRVPFDWLKRQEERLASRRVRVA